MEVHIVVKGDTLWKIARQYGIPYEELKRANAHLAKSEYIVPGMKIFLPKKVHGGKQEHVKHPETGKVPVKPTQPTAPPTHQKPTQPTQPKPTHPKPPAPTPKPPVPTPKPPTPKPPVSTPKPPTPKPPVPTPKPPTPTPRPPVPTPVPPLPLPTPSLPATPAPVPQPLPVPTPPPIQMFPMQPCQPCMHHPMIGIPCGWIPIFDADCHPFMHSGQIQAMSYPSASQEPAPLPLPTPSLPSTQFPMYEEPYEESPIFSSQGPAMVPQQMPMVEGWQLIESPDYLSEESPEMDLQPSAWCPPEQGYIPQSIAPAMQQGFPMMPFPSYHQGCGCGCDGQQNHHQQHHHQQHPMMMMMPLYYGQPCNCQSSMQPTPYQMMPTPYQGSNWYGSY